MRRLLATAFVVLLCTLTAGGSALAFEGGGRKPSEAPSITIGQHYAGALNNHRNDSNFDGGEIALWHLPPVTTRDVIAVDWEEAHYSSQSRASEFPICLVLVQGINDFNWGERFEKSVDSGFNYEQCIQPSASGTAHTQFIVQEANSTSTYLEFHSFANESDPSKYETFPYSFTVEPVLHYLSVALRPVKQVSPTGIVQATANLASGLAAPDGLPFTLTVTWPKGGVASYAGVSAGGVVNFQLALPETAFGRQASFVVSHPADGTYQAISTEKLLAKVAKPQPAGPTPCSLAEARVVSLRRALRRLTRRARYAKGRSRRALRHRARRERRKLDGALHQVGRLCG
jgi:hypothetical protein